MGSKLNDQVLLIMVLIIRILFKVRQYYRLYLLIHSFNDTILQIHPYLLSCTFLCLEVTDMKKQKKYRFYIWDYVWWLGDKHQEKSPGSKLDGPWMFCYYSNFIPAIVVIILGKINSSFIYVGSYLLLLCIPLFLLWDLWLHKILYNKKRRKAVMKHYASRKHSSTMAYVVMLLPVILFFIVIFTDMSITNHNKPAPQISQEEEIENIHRLRTLMPDSGFIRQPRRFRNYGEQ